jgi:C4-dicarboxylate transporter, DctM subunit
MRLRALGRVWGIVALFTLVIGGIYIGAFTPTEAAGIGAFGAFLFVLLRNGFSWRMLREVAIESARTTAVMFLVLIGALIFSNFINVAGMSTALGDLIQGLRIAPVFVIIAILGIYLILGCVFESMSMVLLTVPVFFPIVQQQGIDAIWFGVLVVIATEISLITPPVGLNVFVIKGIYKDIETMTIFRGVMPFVVADLVLVALVIAFPDIALFFPSSMK